MVEQGEVGWYTQRVNTAWLCLGLPAKMLQLLHCVLESYIVSKGTLALDNISIAIVEL